MSYEKDKERREWYISHGICPKCGQKELQRGYKLCLECRMSDNERRRGKKKKPEAYAAQREAAHALRDRRKAEGLCPRCGRKPEPGFVTCERCKAKNRRAMEKQSEAKGRLPRFLRDSPGYCTYCCRKIDDDKKLCPECYERAVSSAAEMRKRQNNAGHKWQEYNLNDVLRIKSCQANGEPPKIDFEG